MWTARSFRPRLEVLEDRLPPSDMSPAAAPPEPPAQSSAASTSHHYDLSGEVSGTFTTQISSSDGGTFQTMNGTGTISPLGSVQVSGRLHTPGSQGGYTQGTLNLTNSQGSVTVWLISTQAQPAFSGAATQYRFMITNATGAYTRATGSGTATLQETGGTFNITFQPGR